MQAADRAVEIVDPIEGERQIVLTVLAQSNDGGLVVVASAVSATATGRATRTAASPERKSAKPNGLLKLAWTVRDDASIDTESPSPDIRVHLRQPALCLLVEQDDQGRIEIGLQRLLSHPARPGEACRGRAEEAEGVRAELDANRRRHWTSVCNSRLWSAPLVQPPWLSGFITWESSGTTSRNGRCR